MLLCITESKRFRFRNSKGLTEGKPAKIQYDSRFIGPQYPVLLKINFLAPPGEF